MSPSAITRVDVREHDIPLSRPYTIATASYDRVTNFVVELRAGRLWGMGIDSFPARNLPVSDPARRCTPARVPDATMCPPLGPAPGPKSTM